MAKINKNLLPTTQEKNIKALARTTPTGVGFNYDTDYLISTCKCTKQDVLAFIHVYKRNFAHYKMKKPQDMKTVMLRSTFYNSFFVSDFKEFMNLNRELSTLSAEIKRFEVGTSDFYLKYDEMLKAMKKLNVLLGETI